MLLSRLVAKQVEAFQPRVDYSDGALTSKCMLTLPLASEEVRMSWPSEPAVNARGPPGPAVTHGCLPTFTTGG